MLEHQQRCAKKIFRIVGWVGLRTISLTDVYERLIHAAIQWK
jgi:hypothetical protein